ncbi:MAG: hypothetical protein N3A63_00850 [Bacteroidetes bacterium]|nr:hypothetical protein [Bacteroidota bacterium]
MRATIYMLCVACCISCLQREHVNNNPRDTTFIGFISISGNEPFTYILIRDTLGSSFEIVSDSLTMQRLKQCQGYTVKLQGTITRKHFRKAIVVRSFIILNN